MKIDSISNLTYMPGLANAGRAAGIQQPLPNKSYPTEVAPPDNGLTGAERAFFSRLFPGSAHQIGAHNTYTPTGFSTPVELGQIVNRKG